VRWVVQVTLLFEKVFPALEGQLLLHLLERTLVVDPSIFVIRVLVLKGYIVSLLLSLSVTVLVLVSRGTSIAQRDTVDVCS